MRAGRRGWGQGGYADGIAVEAGALGIGGEIEGGLETLKLKLPAVVTADLRLNEPRFASLPNIMKAKKKPIDTLSAEDLGVDCTPRVETLEVSEPAGRDAGVRVESVAELVEKLRNEAKVI